MIIATGAQCVAAMGLGMSHTAILIEDSQTQSAVISKMLIQRNWSVVASTSIDQAVESFSGLSAPITLLDLHLGDVDALEELPRVRRAWPRTPIAAMTSAEPTRLRRAAELGCEFLLRKPFQEMELGDVLVEGLLRAVGGRGRPSVLIVDDSDTVRRIAGVTAREADFRPALAASMEEALARLSWDRIDCVVTDIFMPGMGGIEGIQRIRETRPEIAIVAMSGGLDRQMTFDHALEAARRIGADRCLPKPFNPVQFGAAVRAALMVRARPAA